MPAFCRAEWTDHCTTPHAAGPNDGSNTDSRKIERSYSMSAGAPEKATLPPCSHHGISRPPHAHPRAGWRWSLCSITARPPPRSGAHGPNERPHSRGGLRFCGPLCVPKRYGHPWCRCLGSACIGLPCAVCDIGGVDRLIEDRNSGIIAKAEDPRAIPEKIARIPEAQLRTQMRDRTWQSTKNWN